MDAVNSMNSTNITHSTHSDKTRARLLALAMHAVFILLIVFGVSWQKKPQPPVEATLWSNLPPMVTPPQPQAEPAPQSAPTPEPPKPAQQVPRVTPPPPAPKMVQVPLKPDIAIKKDDKEKPPPKVTPKPQVQDTPKPEPKKREDEAAKLEREQEVQRELAAKVAADKVAAEKATVERTARAAAARENQKYISGIYAKVWGRVAVPPDMQGNPEAVFMVSLLPGGELQSIDRVQSSGNTAYDAAIERAIRQAQPFTVPSGDEFQRSFRRFSMAFRPQR